MSDNLARVLDPEEPGFAPTARPDERRHFEIVSSRSQRRARPRIVYALTASAGMAAVVVAQLLLSVGISQGAYEISTLQASQVELGRTTQSVTEDLVRVSSPQSLAANAEALGMVTSSNPAYLRLSDGAVLGAPSSASLSSGGAADLVPNALLAGRPLVTQLTPAGAQGTGIAGKGTAGRSAAAHLPHKAAPAAAHDGLPSPKTR
ncbi:MAG TPA: hypothetical protein VFC59_02685 [Cryobacterium sp.]|nr:hypothetical protein [Cryobacterium sp.]